MDIADLSMDYRIFLDQTLTMLTNVTRLDVTSAWKSNLLIERATNRTSFTDMSNPKTTWEDLARLGWPIHEVYKKANAHRGGSMKGHGDIFLNSGVAADYQWWSYNTLIGEPYIAGRRPDTVVHDETTWSYDNTKNSKPHQEEWTEEWTNTNSASVTIASSASITLSSRITFFNVAESGFDITISTDSSSTESKEESYKLSRTWTLEVGPFEKLSLIRVKTIRSEVVDYVQAFGLEGSSMIGTKGDKYNGHYYWGMYLNSLLGNPRGKFNLQGSGKVISFNFKIVREGPNGRSVFKLPIDFHEQASEVPTRVLHKWAEMEKSTLGDAAQMQVMIPGIEKEEE